MSGDCTVALTDGSRDERGRVAGGWCDSRGGKGCKLGGLMATGWDGDVTGIRLALKSLPVSSLLVLLDSRAVIASVMNAGACGHARTVDLRAVVDLAVEWASAGMRGGASSKWA